MDSYSYQFVYDVKDLTLEHPANRLDYEKLRLVTPSGVIVFEDIGFGQVCVMPVFRTKYFTDDTVIVTEDDSLYKVCIEYVYKSNFFVVLESALSRTDHRIRNYNASIGKIKRLIKDLATPKPKSNKQKPRKSLRGPSKCSMKSTFKSDGNFKRWRG